MVRGAAKEAAQVKNAKKQESMKKAGSQLGMAEKAMALTCAICKVKMPTLQNLKDHHLSKHPTNPLPAGIEEGFQAEAAKKAEFEKKKAAKVPLAAGGGGEKKKAADADLSLLMEGLGKSKKK